MIKSCPYLTTDRNKGMKRLLILLLTLGLFFTCEATMATDGDAG